MYSYITCMCHSCPGCGLTNPTRTKSSKLVYNFPIEALFLVLHINSYQAGKKLGFKGSSHYLSACCRMCTFVVMELVANANATMYAFTIMNIILRFGFCHTCVLDKDSRLFGVCREALNLLQINHHVLSGGNHNPMLVKRLNQYLTKGLQIMTNERSSNCIALEAILLLIYVWNLCPVPGTDISRCMVALGRKFSFTIDFSRGKHMELYSAGHWNPIQHSLQLAFSAVGQLLKCSLRSNAAGTASLSTPNSGILTFIQLGKLCLPIGQLALILSMVALTNKCTHSRVPGRLLSCYPGHPTNSSLPQIPLGRTKSMPPSFLPTPQNSYLFSL
jgi:hypothetical protein